jgi:hypothetical protein
MIAEPTILKCGRKDSAIPCAHVYYKGYRFGKDTAPLLSRHGILHGRVSDYRSVLNSPPVFLFLDMIGNIWLEKQRATSPTIQ